MAPQPEPEGESQPPTGETRETSDTSGYLYICAGCTTLLRDTTRLYEKVIYTGPATCIACESNLEGGFLMSNRAKARLGYHRAYLTRELFYEFSQYASKRNEDGDDVLDLLRQLLRENRR